MGGGGTEREGRLAGGVAREREELPLLRTVTIDDCDYDGLGY